ncbi:unnamed protein product [Ambrosiozyma monospora]|uniref:Unnamed protein product n=1 Tax=Ambrosiozyma monospora TaxID=43982 RepID=A0ACB5UBG4_AMBMO|nr:unnamed protein product [Ambrosiozyma monospora]
MFGYCNSAFTSMLPGVFDLVPGGVASRNVLKAGIVQLNAAKNGTLSTTSVGTDSSFTFGFTMIEISIGISVGLFLSTLLVYPLGKKNTGIFSL